jgi:hypothetical protein
MSSLRRRLLDLTAEAVFPLDKDTMLALVEQSQDVELLLVVSGLQDGHYSSPDELEHRFNDALGMPDALPSESALAPSEGWLPDAADDVAPA